MYSSTGYGGGNGDGILPKSNGRPVVLELTAPCANLNLSLLKTIIQLC
ncbi:hypothetical protein SAMN05216167_112182 [Spirosoma endophyticum]|uniref:Uncharacterized protein n=1 Tax=Spirosoma endophyticum TaxID=662367 RepID=A0A1I1ZP66_9BACT|nr:hypothetical protein SAMN05216167_112182 [Spirosoma endophyticum]